MVRVASHLVYSNEKLFINQKTVAFHEVIHSTAADLGELLGVLFLPIGCK